MCVCVCVCVCGVEISKMRQPRAELSSSATVKNNRPLSLNTINIGSGLVEALVNYLLPR